MLFVLLNLIQNPNMREKKKKPTRKQEKAYQLLLKWGKVHCNLVT